MSVSEMLKEIRAIAKLTQAAVARQLNSSLVSVNRWERGAANPSPAQVKAIANLLSSVKGSRLIGNRANDRSALFLARGLDRRIDDLPLFRKETNTLKLADLPGPALISRTTFQQKSKSNRVIRRILKNRIAPARTVTSPPTAGMSAGKNTYTYDAHTYHTKVPPQGIAELITHYLPDGGLVVDPFSGSGMTGVAARTVGSDCILNELSPAACFISDRFTSTIPATLFKDGIELILAETQDLRSKLYSTTCRECGRKTEAHYFIWSYKVSCARCAHEFVLWDACRQYGKSVKEHKILSEFPCPSCASTIKKSTLKRTEAVPVQVGYKCCRSQIQHSVHPLSNEDLALVEELNRNRPLAPSFFPTNELPDGVNLRQPAKHGLTSIDRFYTVRNLSALSNLWLAIHKIEDVELSLFLAFVFTSLYQRVSRLSEFRFWGGSGNTARFNVPFIFNESNVFQTFIRKARSIQDHLETTASMYQGNCAIVRGSATNLSVLPDNSVDLIFTDPPFGANINYSEMNFLWESWLGEFTQTRDEAIMNRCQEKGVVEYQQLMTASMRECHRVLRDEHWMLLVFMNSSEEVWRALKAAIVDAGFNIISIDTFDKQHCTFKQFVSQNTAGMDLVLHCRKTATPLMRTVQHKTPILEAAQSIRAFLKRGPKNLPTNEYLHVSRESEVDYRTLYSEWLSGTLQQTDIVLSFIEFRQIVSDWLKKP